MLVGFAWIVSTDPLEAGAFGWLWVSLSPLVVGAPRVDNPMDVGRPLGTGGTSWCRGDALVQWFNAKSTHDLCGEGACTCLLGMDSKWRPSGALLWMSTNQS